MEKCREKRSGGGMPGFVYVGGGGCGNGRKHNTSASCTTISRCWCWCCIIDNVYHDVTVMIRYHNDVQRLNMR